MKKLIALFSFVLFFYPSQADNFIVTSSADSGPGTLREAITFANANGTTIPDNISFNIPQTTYNLRIINLVTELPSLSSNMVIDGTTQPGNSYGTTDAKICIKKNDYAPFFSMIKIENAQNVQIAGLHLYYGYWQGFFGTPFRSSSLYGVNIINSTRIQVGVPNKGNVIQGVVHCIYSKSAGSGDISIQSNYLGHKGFYANTANDIDPVIIMSECGITLASAKNILIGGAQPNEGNIFGSKTRGINIDSENATGNGFITIANNLLGREFDKVTVIRVYDFWDAYIHIGRSRNNPYNWTSSNLIDYKVTLLDNNIGSHASITNVSDSLIIKRNKWEDDHRENGRPYKLGISKCPRGGIIGGTDNADANIFRNKLLSNSFWSLGIFESGPITVLKNVFECNSKYGSTTWINNPFNVIPFAQVDLTTADSVTGRATPNTRVDLYYDDACSACEGRAYLASVPVNALGTWTYTGPVSGTVVAKATSLAGYTGDFSSPSFNTGNSNLKNPTCGLNNGSITGLATEGAETYFWIRNYNQNDTAGRSLDLSNVGPGVYSVYAVHGGTCVKPGYTFTLLNITPRIITSGAFVKQPSCGLFNGSVSGLAISSGQYSVYKWINNTGQTIGTQMFINNLGAGTYRFVVRDTTIAGGCADTAVFVLTNQSGPSLNTANMQIVPATCSGANGSITSIVSTNVTGTPFIQWVNAQNNPVGNNLNLLNVTSGTYRLKFKDGGACDTIVTPYYTVPGNGAIIIDTSGKIISPSKCTANTGSIQRIQVTGGTSYTWINTATNVQVGNTVNVFNLPPGSYQLVVSNPLYGCSQTSPVITVPQSGFVPLAVTSFTRVDALCLQNSGSIKITGFSNNASLFSFKWTDSITGQTLASGTTLNNLGAGNYLLFATDSNGCEKKISGVEIKSKPAPVFDYSREQVLDESCNLKDGSVSMITLNGLTGPTTYTWYDQDNNVVGNTINLQNAANGTYTLRVQDAGVCILQSKSFTIINNVIGLPQPLYNELLIPVNSNATLMLQNPAPGTYRLYTSPSAVQPLQQNTTGIFTTASISQDTSVYIRRANGSCLSPLVQVKIKVADKSYFTIPTAFTPNGDGLNDLLAAKVIGYVNLNYFKIYNKWGELVFETRKMNDGWNGIFKGLRQETGSYVWIAAGYDINGKLITGKGMFTLLR